MGGLPPLKVKDAAAVATGVALQVQVPTGRLRYSGVQALLDDEYTNYIANGRAWATGSLPFATVYDDGASAVPVDATGGSPGIVAGTRNTSSPIRGVADHLLTKDAADRQGEGWVISITIDAADQGKAIPFYFDYKTSANYAAGDVVMYQTSTTGGLMAMNTKQGSSFTTNLDVATTNVSRYTAQIQTNTTDTTYKIIFHIATTNAGAWTINVSNLFAGPSATVNAPIMTEWLSYTTTSGLTGGTTTSTAYYRRNGDTLEVRIDHTFTSVFTGGTATFTLPAGLTIDTAKLPGASAGQITKFGEAITYDISVTAYFAYVAYNSTTLVQVVAYADDLGGGSSIGGALVTTTAPFTWANGDRIMAEFKVPIVGWGSGALVSTTESEQLVCTARATGNAASATAGNPIIFPTETYDTHNAYSTSTGRYTCPRAGILLVSGAGISASSASTTFNLYKNAVIDAVIGVTDSNAEITFTGTVQVAAGDIIDIRPDATFDASSGTINFVLLPTFTAFGVYGVNELKAITTSIKTPGATDNYHLLTGNSIALTPGTWRLFGGALFTNGGTTPLYTTKMVGFWAANGADSNTEPALLSAAAGVTFLSPSGYYYNYYDDILSLAIAPAPEIIIKVTASVTVFVVTYSLETTASNARITAYATAERLQ